MKQTALQHPNLDGVKIQIDQKGQAPLPQPLSNGIRTAYDYIYALRSDLDNLKSGYSTIQHNGNPVAPETIANFIDGTNVVLTIVDDSINGRTNITVGVTGSGGTGAKNTVQHVFLVAGNNTITPTPVSPAVGDFLTILALQPSTGDGFVTWAPIFAGVSSNDNMMKANVLNSYLFTYDGTNWRMITLPNLGR